VVQKIDDKGKGEKAGRRENTKGRNKVRKEDTTETLPVEFQREIFIII
jgi:hypothetical protein